MNQLLSVTKVTKYFPDTANQPFMDDPVSHKEMTKFHLKNINFL